MPAPKFEQVPIEPFTKEEIEALLKACEFSHEACTTLRRKFVMRRVNVHRDQALIVLLFDTGLRAALHFSMIMLANEVILYQRSSAPGDSSARAFNVIVKVVPFPMSLSAVIVPPCASTIERAIANPSPDSPIS